MSTCLLGSGACTSHCACGCARNIWMLLLGKRDIWITWITERRLRLIVYYLKGVHTFENEFQPPPLVFFMRFHTLSWDLIQLYTCKFTHFQKNKHLLAHTNEVNLRQKLLINATCVCIYIYIFLCLNWWHKEEKRG